MSCRDRTSTRTRGWLAIAGGGLVAGVGLVVACSRSAVEAPDGPVHVEEDVLEVPELADESVMRQVFLRVEAVATGGSGTSHDLARWDGRRVFVCAYRLERRALCGTGEGADLGAAVTSAVQDLLVRAGPRNWSRALWKVDFVVSSEARRWPAAGFDHGVGEHGMVVRRGDAISWLTPSEILEIPVFRIHREDEPGALDQTRLRDALVERDPSVGPLDADFTFDRIRTVSWVARSPGEGIVRTYRTHAWAYPSLDQDDLLERAFWAADHLAAITDVRGRIRYLYDPAEDRVQGGYNLLRHGGSAWSLISAWERTKYEPWLEASRAAIGFLLAHTRVQERHGPFGGGRTRWVVESQRIKLGGAGLGLLALAEYTAATGDERWLPEAREFATYLVSAQKESGEFEYFGHMTPGAPPEEETSAYYPGEAIVGLMRLHTIDPNPLWLATAERGARWLIEVRDAGKSPKKLANDHWLMIGLSRLYAETRAPLWRDHALALADAVEFQQQRHARHVRYHRDYRGGYYEPPRSTPAATRGEGLVAVLDLCAMAERPCEGARRVLEETVRHELQTQYTPETSWWLSAPDRAFGAFYGGLADVTIRNDYVQHNLSSVLGLERHLRAERGQRLPGGPTWTAAEQHMFLGLSDDQVARLRAPALAVRGPTWWDRVVQARAVTDQNRPDAIEAGGADPAIHRR